MKRANPKKAARKAEKEKKGGLTKEEENRINAASKIIIAEAIYYLFTEHGWRKVRVDRLMDAYAQAVEDYCKEFKRKYHTPGIRATYAVRDLKHEIKDIYDLKLDGTDKIALTHDILAIMMMCRALRTFGWGAKRLALYIESIEAILNEIANPNLEFGLDDMYVWCEEVTGVDVKNVVAE